jgi:tetratricopeptide (TPR) repeat protein
MVNFLTVEDSLQLPAGSFNSYRFLIVFLAVICCSGCAPRLGVPDIRPRVDWEAIRNVALLRFDGPYGESARRQVHNRLTKVQHFNSIDTTQYPALAEASYDEIGDATFIDMLKNLQADIVLGGHVTADLNETHGTDRVEMKEGTGYYKKEKNVHGEWVDVEIKRTVIRSLPYVIRQASLTTDFKVLDLKSNRIIATGKLTENYDGKIGGDKSYPSADHKPGEIPSPNATMDELAARIAARLVAKLSRMKTAALIEFDNSGNRMVRRGVARAKDGAWEDAMQLWQEVIRKEPNNATALYNLGVAHESLGDLENLRTAIDLYEKAATYGDKSLYADGIARVNRIIKQSDNN